jgi:hypothetical protein
LNKLDVLSKVTPNTLANTNFESQQDAWVKYAWMMDITCKKAMHGNMGALEILTFPHWNIDVWCNLKVCLMVLKLIPLGKPFPSFSKWHAKNGQNIFMKNKM